MKIKLNENEELELLYSFRSNIYFEDMQGHSIDYEHFSANDLITLFYAVFIASLQKARKPIIPMIDFLDIIDENGGEQCLMEFSDWYTKTIYAQFEQIKSSIDEKEDTKKK